MHGIDEKFLEKFLVDLLNTPSPIRLHGARD